MSADDLDTLDPQPAVVQFRGERLEIRPLTVGQLPRFSRLVRPVVDDFVAGNEAWSLSDDVMVAEVMEKHGEAIIEAAALACGRPVEFIAGNRNAAELLDLAHRVVEVNRDFFFPDGAGSHARAEPRANRTDHGWAGDIDYLVGAGYSLTEIKGLTLAQFKAFSRAAARRERDRLVNEARTVRAASQYLEGDWNRFMAELDKES